MFEVTWTGTSPCVCVGTWFIKKNGVDVSDAIPESLRHSHMNTHGIYSEVCYANGQHQKTEYEDGLDDLTWIFTQGWIDRICDSLEEKKELYCAIQANDWRRGGCGRCLCGA